MRSISKHSLLQLFFSILLIQNCCHQIYAVSSLNNFNLSLIQIIKTEGEVMDIQVQSGFVYIADNENGLFIYNISDINEPIELAHVSGAIGANSLTIQNNLAYLAVLFEGLQIYNLSNLDHITLSGEYSDDGALCDIKYFEDTVYIADHGTTGGVSQGVKILNVSDPAVPNLITHHEVNGRPSNLMIEDSKLFLADYQTGIEILNISNPVNPLVITKVKKNPGYFGIYVNSPYIYLTQNNDDKGLFIYDYSDLENISLVSFVELSGDPCDLQIHDTSTFERYAYVANGESGLQIINVTDATRPSVISEFHNGGSPFDVAVFKDFILVADMEDGVEILQFSSSSKLTIRSYPIGFLSLVLVFLGFHYWYIRNKNQPRKVNSSKFLILNLQFPILFFTPFCLFDW